MVWMFYFKNWIKRYTSYSQETPKLHCLNSTWFNMYVLRFINSIYFCATRYYASFSVKVKPVTCEPVFFLVNMVNMVKSCSDAESPSSLKNNFHNWLFVTLAWKGRKSFLSVIWFSHWNQRASSAGFPEEGWLTTFKSLYKFKKKKNRLSMTKMLKVI